MIANLIDNFRQIYFNKSAFYKTVEKIGCKNYECKTIYSSVDFPCTSAIYISSNKNQWTSFEDVFAFFLIRSHFIYESWIESNQKILTQETFDNSSFQWIDQIDFFEDIYSDGVFRTVFNPQVIELDSLLKQVTDWFKANKATQKNIDIIKEELNESYFINLHAGYLYDRLFFGESDTRYMYIRLLLSE